LELFTSIAGEAALAVHNAVLRRRVDELKEGERRRLERLLRDLPTGVLLLDGERRVVLMNDRAAEWLPQLSTAPPGHALEALGGVPLDALLDADGFVELHVAGPPPRVFVASAVPSTLGDGEVVLVLRDVTVERESERRGARAERMAAVGQLASGIAH